ncbi:MAG: hypothetical protein ACLFP4_13940, partial [Spirochaetales bacterium]
VIMFAFPLRSRLLGSASVAARVSGFSRLTYSKPGNSERTILFADHLINEVLLKIPHRQFVFTLPKVLRPFFHHDRRLFAEVSRLIYRIID